MQIHHIITTEVDRFLMDPTLGPVKRRELVMKASDTHSIVYAGRTFDIQPDGTFDVDEDVATFLLGRKDLKGSWFAGPSPFPPEEANDIVAAKPRTPRKTA